MCVCDVFVLLCLLGFVLVVGLLCCSLCCGDIIVVVVACLV